MADGLTMTRRQAQAMRDHVAACLPEEGCGLLLGENGRVEQVAPVTNALHSATRYRMDAQEQLDWLLRLEETGKALLAIFHSHPAGPAQPSQRDLAEWAYPGAVMIVWAPRDGDWAMRGFCVEGGRVREVALRVTDIVERQ